MKQVLVSEDLLRQALQAHTALREWIKAVPDDIQLPAMPGVDGDWLDKVQGELTTALEQQVKEPDALCRVVECASRLVKHADFQLGGVLSADSKAKDIPSRAASTVKSRHLAALRDALANTAQQPLPSQITEGMHRAACKVLLRANGLDGLPQRMLDAMRATAPQAQEPLQ